MHLQVKLRLIKKFLTIFMDSNISSSIARIYSNGKQFSELMSLIKQNEEFFSAIPKAKTAKIIRNIISFVATSPDSLDIQISLCMDVVEWCKHEKRTFLRQRIEAKVNPHSLVLL